MALTTEATLEAAECLARVLLERRLAGCISLVPAQSLYHWQGEVQQASEVQVLIKTTAGQLESLHRAVQELHSYETSMWVTWHAGTNHAYGTWLAEAIDPPGARPPGDADSPGNGDPTG
jgi:periplasmic divalent cation tolerance protein